MKFTQIVSSAGWLKNPFPFYIYPIIPARIPSLRAIITLLSLLCREGVAHRVTRVSRPTYSSPQSNQ